MAMNIPGVVSLSETGVTPAINGAVTLTQGSNVTITQSGQAITIAATAGSGGDTSRISIGDIFGDSADYSITNVGGGAATLDGSGLDISTSATATSSSSLVRSTYGSLTDILGAGDSSIYIGGFVATAPTTGDSFFGTGSVTVTGSAITYTPRQMGFKIVYAASAATLSATNANGTTETATTISGVTVTDRNEYFARHDSGVDCKFYTNRTLQATHTTNLPDGNTTNRLVAVAVSNKDTATNFNLGMGPWCYQANQV